MHAVFKFAGGWGPFASSRFSPRSSISLGWNYTSVLYAAFVYETFRGMFKTDHSLIVSIIYFCEEISGQLYIVRCISYISDSLKNYYYEYLVKRYRKYIKIMQHGMYI